MLSIGSMGIALREIGSDGGPVTIVTRLKDFNMLEIPQPGNKTVAVHPVDQLFAFTAVAFRELGEASDVWEFRIMENTPAGPSPSLLYLRGSDIFWLKCRSRVLPHG